MLFNSYEFFIFFAFVLVVYFLVSLKSQNYFLLVASYFFYGWWDWRFLSLILISTIIDYYCGIAIHNTKENSKRKGFVTLSVFTNLSILGLFKYWNFFTENLINLFGTVGIAIDFHTLNIILPVGISFYTFQTMTYSIDIYRGDLQPTKNFINFALFVSFFPQLVAGPIERAKNLLPQIESKRHFNKKQFIDGLNLIFWGMFMKVFVADNLGVIVDKYFDNTDSNGIEYILATIAFAFQIFGDFSGYSNIARGASKCMGFEIMVNFKEPYLAISPSDLWRRWHISLSTWLRDYLYIPLGGNKKGKYNTYRNLMLTMLLGGLWHGAAWNFVIWGFYHGLLLCIYRILNIKDNISSKSFSSEAKHISSIFWMFTLTSVSWIFFRASSLAMIKNIFIKIFTQTGNILENLQLASNIFLFISIPILVLIYTYLSENNLLKNFSPVLKFVKESVVLKTSAYATLTYLICFYAAKAKSFIYFQF